MKHKDLKTGMVVKESKSSPMLITGVNSPTTVEFFGGENNIKFLDVNDSYSGQALRTVSKDETFQLLVDKEREKILQIILHHLIDSQSNIEDCISIVKTAQYGKHHD